MGTNVFKGWMADNDPRWGTTSITVGRALSLGGRPPAPKHAEDGEVETPDDDGAAEPQAKRTPKR